MLSAMSHPIPMSPPYRRLPPEGFRPSRAVFASLAFAAAVLLVAGCKFREKASDTVSANAGRSGGTILLFNAASIGRPLRVLADSFTARTSIAVVQQSQSSLELARKLTEFNDIPDVIALADYKVFSKLLAPKYLDGWWIFARNRLVIAYTDKSKYQNELANDGWRKVITRSDVEVGRSDPNTDPSGYRTLMAFQLAELHYNEKGLAEKLLAAAPTRNVRPREADQVGLLQAGALDYIWTYENLARGSGLKFVELPSSIDLGTAADSLTYAKASVRVAGKQRGDSVTFAGEPILYGVAVPIAAPDSARAQQFVQFMLSADGQRILKSAALDALETPIASGSARKP